MHYSALSTQFLSTFMLSLAVSLACAFIVMTLQGWLQRLRGCGGLLTMLLVIVVLIGLAVILSPTQ
jgi:predicted PurR-regulated permease PerM